MRSADRGLVALGIVSALVGLTAALVTQPSTDSVASTDETIASGTVTGTGTGTGTVELVAADPTGSTAAGQPGTPAAAATTQAPSTPSSTPPPGLTATPTTAAPTTIAPTTIAPTTTRDPNAPRSVSMLFTGDILTENPVLDAGRAGATAAGTGGRFDFTPVFAPIAPLVQSVDLAICHMEIPIGRPDEEPGAKGRSPFGGNRLLAPFEIVAAIKATGFDRCSTASNHAYDTGDSGNDSTIDSLEAAGISWSGTARRPDELPPGIFEVYGVRVAHLSYTIYSNVPLPEDEWRLAYTNNPARVASEVESARAAGADIVVVSMHLSKELLEDPLPETRQFAEAVIASSSVDAIVHHGPHVVQGFEEINGTPVWWSIGNLVTGMARPNPMDRYTDPRTRDGLAAILRFTETAPGTWDVDASSVVLCNEMAARTIHPGVTAAADPAVPPAIREEMAGCVERTRVAVPDAG